jgi:hypothetical protein
LHSTTKHKAVALVSAMLEERGADTSLGAAGQVLERQLERDVR